MVGFPISDLRLSAVSAGEDGTGDSVLCGYRVIITHSPYGT